MVTGKKSKNNKVIHFVTLLGNEKPVSLLSMATNDNEKVEEFKLELTIENYKNDERLSSLMNKVVNREKPETVLLDLSSLEPVTHKCAGTYEHMIEKIDDTVPELLSKSPGWGTVS